MPQGRLVNLARSSFVRTPPALAERIARTLLAFPQGKTVTILDPTAGEGDLLLPCCSIPHTRVFGVEISAARAALARERLPHAEIISCAFEGVSIPKASMSLVLANPPYFSDDGERVEYRIIADAGTLLAPGGVMVAIIPARTGSAWNATMINHWCRWYDRVRVWKFPDRETPDDESAFEDFTQICVVGIRRADPRDPLPSEQRRLSGYRYHMPAPPTNTQHSAKRIRIGWEQGTPPPTLPNAAIADPYPVPESRVRPQIVVRHADEATLLTALERCGAHLTPWWQAVTTWEEDGLRGQPVMPLSGEAHVAAEVLTGLLDGDIVSGPGPETEAVPHLFTAFVGHEWVSLPIDAEEREKMRERGIVRVAARQWQDKPMLGVLNLATGEIRYEQDDAVFTFLEPWLGTLAARVTRQREPLYRLDPAPWEMRVVSQFGADKQLPNAALPGLAPAQQHRVYAMGRSLDHSGRAAIQGEPGVGKTRLAAAVAACMAYRWRHRNNPLFQQGQEQDNVAAQPAWIRGLRRAWLKNPRTLALLGLEPVRDAETQRVIAYRRADGTRLAPEEAGPRAIPVLVTTPKKVTREYRDEICAAWAEAEVVFIEHHSDIPRWLARCAVSASPVVVGIMSHSLTRAFGRAWQPVVHEKRLTKREPVLEPEEALLPRLDPAYDERGTLVGYRWKKSGERYTREVTISYFFCPNCGGQIKAIPGKLHEPEPRPGAEETPILFARGKQDESAADDDRCEPVTSRTWFTIKPRWCQCRADTRNQPGPRNPDGRTRTRAPLWTDARLEAAQRKHPQLSFASWSQAVQRVQQERLSSMFHVAWQRAFPALAAKRQGKSCERGSVSLAATARSEPPAHAKTTAITKTRVQLLPEGKWALTEERKRRASERYGSRPPLPDSFSPYDYLYRFYRGCVALVIVDESHNGRSKNTDIGHAFRLAMQASQTRLMATGTHYGGDILGFYHYWFGFHPQFWRRLGLGWNDEEKALQRYGVIQEWTKEYESTARKGTGETTVQVSTIPAPGLSAKLLPYLLEDMVYLAVLDVGSHMPPRVEIPEIVSMHDPEVEAPLEQARKAEQDARKRLAALHELLDGADREAEARQEFAAASKHVKGIEAWAAPRRLSTHYRRLVSELDDLAKQRNVAARLAKGTVPRWFATLPCEQPFEVWQTKRDRWGDEVERTLLVSTQTLSWDHRYPLERRLIALVERERAAGRRVMVYFEQNDIRSMARRLEWVLKEFHPWTLPNSVAAEDRQQAILDAVRMGRDVVIVPYRRVNEGLNLQSAVDTIIWYEMALNLFMLDQASRRAWRLGKREEVRIYYMVYANTAGHHKLRKLGQQSGAAAAFAGEPARGALIKEAGADRTTLARLSSLLEQSEADAETENLPTLFAGDDAVIQEETALKAAFARRTEELQAALKAGRAWLGGVSDTLSAQLAALASDPAFTAPVWAECPAAHSFTSPATSRPAQPQRRQVAANPLPVPAFPPLSPVATPVPVPIGPTLTPTVLLPEAYPVAAIGSRAEVIFGRSEHIVLARRRSRRVYGERPKRRAPVVERDIPALSADVAIAGDGQPLRVTVPSLWDLLAAPPTETSARPLPSPASLPRSAQQPAFV
ncbi:MAG: DUF6094 domain-containing protein [Ktedonobacteraceae bacterium]